MIMYVDIDDDVLLSALMMADAQSCSVAVIINDAVRDYTREGTRKQHAPEPQGHTIGEAEALSDGAIYAAVSQRMGDKTTIIDGEEVQPEPDRAPIPLWAQVRRSDDRFVNKATGLDLGNEFEIAWGHRKNEFSTYDETRDRALPGMNEISPFADSERGKLHDADAKSQRNADDMGMPS